VPARMITRVGMSTSQPDDLIILSIFIIPLPVFQLA
jgi:hypothetical protein